MVLHHDTGRRGSSQNLTKHGIKAWLTAIPAMLIFLGAALTLFSPHSEAETGAAIPQAAKAAGYTKLTFDGEFIRNTIDLNNSTAPGFDWYLAQFFGQTATASHSVVTNSDGSVTLSGKDTVISINSAAPRRGAPDWVGTAFGGGGYFEAIVKFDPAKTMANIGSQWPAFWSMAIEHLDALPGEQWLGQATGYSHFIEPDFFEYDVANNFVPNQYGGAIHDWYGIQKRTCRNKGYCGVTNASGGGSSFTNFRVRVPSKTDFTKFHSFGFLWVPATSTAMGYARYYFDGIATSDRVTWSKYSDQPPPPGLAPWTFGIIDRQHLVIALTTGPNQPLTIKKVIVYQASAAHNLTNSNSEIVGPE